MTCWKDSTIVIQWLNDKEHYKGFASNGVSKILEHEFVAWEYIPTKQNLTDIGSEGSLV